MFKPQIKKSENKNNFKRYLINSNYYKFSNFYFIFFWLLLKIFFILFYNIIYLF